MIINPDSPGIQTKKRQEALLAKYLASGRHHDYMYKQAPKFIESRKYSKGTCINNHNWQSNLKLVELDWDDAALGVSKLH